MLFFCREVQNQLSGGEWLNLARASEQQEGSGQLQNSGLGLLLLAGGKRGQPSKCQLRARNCPEEALLQSLPQP